MGKFSKKNTPRIAHKTNIKNNNSYKEGFKEQVTAEGEEMNVKIVTMDVNKLKHLQDLLAQTGQEYKQLVTKIKWKI